MSNLRTEAHAVIQRYIDTYQDEQIAVDILRVIQEEASLMKETEDVCDAITTDPYENLSGIPSRVLDRFKKILRVTVCDRQRCGLDFARIYAIVTFPTKTNRTSQLYLTYERKPQRGGPPNEKGYHPCQVSYTIEQGYDHGERQRILDVMIWAASNVPSTKSPVCIEDKLEDGWEDVDDDNDDDNDDERIQQSKVSPDVVQRTKKQRIHGSSDGQRSDDDDGDGGGNGNTGTKKTGDDNDDSDRDEYMAALDGVALHSFVQSAGLEPLDDATAFFLLMTFPFFEHEWDIVGLVLDQIFGRDSDAEEDED